MLSLVVDMHRDQRAGTAQERRAGEDVKAAARRPSGRIAARDSILLG